MKNKYKLTGFAKFIMFMLVFLPTSYLGLSLYKGEIAVNDITDKFIYKFTIHTDEGEDLVQENCSDILQLKEKEIKLLKERIQLLENAQ